jgi:alkanesulfonate monooxygenase SsuD/methylene tetrahydromethanopterin reductase-like flavin-dependent oxidoreductase (luciferase family)
VCAGERESVRERAGVGWREREGECVQVRDKGREDVREGAGEYGRGRMRERVCVCVCVCVQEREGRMRVRECV